MQKQDKDIENKKIFLNTKQEFILLISSFASCVLIIIIFLFCKDTASCFLKYIILILFSTSLSLFVFGAIHRLESSGQFNGKIFGINLTFGGPAALCAFLIWFGFYSKIIDCDKDDLLVKKPFNYNIILKDSLGDQAPLSSLEKLTIELNGMPYHGIVDIFNSRFLFEGLPPDYICKKEVNVQLTSDTFLFKNGTHNTTIDLCGMYTDLIIKKISPDTSHFVLTASGSVLDEGDNPIADARVSAMDGDNVAYSDSNGNYKLSIVSQLKSQRLVKITIEKKGYEAFTDNFDFPSFNNKSWISEK